MTPNTLKEILLKMEHYCSYRERSIKEVRTKMLPFHLSLNDENSIIEQLKDNDFIDENRLVTNYIHSKLFSASWGKMKIVNGLFQKGIATSVIEKTFNQIDKDDYLEVLNKTAEKWLLLNENVPDQEAKLYRYLMSKGFEQHVITTYKLKH
ncbi:MAG: RecX family transcriptional regulator [Bacteroidales bacterium]|jgi:regulatory protein|nr:RecX family transcriptional regulator [Bacteroidales bacterium]